MTPTRAPDVHGEKSTEWRQSEAFLPSYADVLLKQNTDGAHGQGPNMIYYELAVSMSKVQKDGHRNGVVGPCPGSTP